MNYQRLVKELRKKLILSQEEFAKLEEIIEINKEEDLLLQNRYSQGC